MQNLLVIERSSGHGSWALYNGSEKLVSKPFEAGLPRAPTWYTDVISGIKTAGIAPQALGALLVGTGPGSFSGIRAVLGAMQGLALPQGIPVLGLSSAAALARAAALRNGAETVAVVGDARRGTLWCAVYDVTDGGALTLHSTGAAPTHTAADFSLTVPDELARLIPAGTLVISSEFTKLSRIISGLPEVKTVAEDLFATADDLAALYNTNPGAALRDPLPVYLHPAVVA